MELNTEFQQSSEFSLGKVRDRISDHPDVAPLLYTAFSEDSLKIAQTLAAHPETEITLRFPMKGQLEPVVTRFQEIRAGVEAYMKQQDGISLAEPDERGGLEVKKLQGSDEASRALAQKILIDAIPRNQGQSLGDVGVNLEVWAGSTVAIRFDTSEAGVEAYKNVLGVTFRDADGTEITDQKIMKGQLFQYPGFTIERDNFNEAFRKQFQGDVVVMLGDRDKVRQHEVQEVIQHFADFQTEQFLQTKENFFSLPLHNLTPKKVSELLLTDDETVERVYGKSKKVILEEINTLTPSQVAWSIARSQLAHVCADVSLLQPEDRRHMQAVLQEQIVNSPQELVFATEEMSPELAEKLGQGYEEAMALVKGVKAAALQLIDGGKEPALVASLIRSYTINPAEFLAHHAKNEYEKYVSQRAANESKWQAVTTFDQAQQILMESIPQVKTGVLTIESKIEGRFIHDEGTLRTGEVIMMPMLASELIVLGPLSQQGGMSGAYLVGSCEEIQSTILHSKVYQVLDGKGLSLPFKIVCPPRLPPYVIDKDGVARDISVLIPTEVHKLFVKEAITDTTGGERLIHLALRGYRASQTTQLDGLDPVFNTFDGVAQSTLITMRETQIKALMDAIQKDFQQHLSVPFQGKTLEQEIKRIKEELATEIVLSKLSAQGKIEGYTKLRTLYSSLLFTVQQYTNEKIVPAVQRVADRFEREVFNAAKFSNTLGLGLDTYIVPLRAMKLSSDVSTSPLDPIYNRKLLVSEYIQGALDASVLLAHTMKQGNRFGEKDLLTIARCMTIALKAIEKNGIVHRDVKPANILLTLHTDGSVAAAYLTDFGIANKIGTDTIDLDHLGAKTAHSGTEAFGSQDYAAPEQSKAPLATTMDIHGLGATLYTLATGESVFLKSGPNREAALTATLTKNKVNGVLAELIVSMVRINPNDRPTHFADIEQALYQLEYPNLMVNVDPAYTLERFNKLESFEEIRDFFRGAFIPPNRQRVHFFTDVLGRNCKERDFQNNLHLIKSGLARALRENRVPTLSSGKMTISISDTFELSPGESSGISWFLHLYDKLESLAQSNKLGTYSTPNEAVTKTMWKLFAGNMKDKGIFSREELFTNGSLEVVNKYLTGRNPFISESELGGVLSTIIREGLNGENVKINTAFIIAELYNRIKPEISQNGIVRFNTQFVNKSNDAISRILWEISGDNRWFTIYVESMDAVFQKICDPSTVSGDKKELYSCWKSLVECYMWSNGSLSLSKEKLTKFKQRKEYIENSYLANFNWVNGFADILKPYQRRDGEINTLTLTAVEEFKEAFKNKKRLWSDMSKKEILKIEEQSFNLRVFSVETDEETIKGLSKSEELEDIGKLFMI
ncbi:protein kinase [Candidatus Roizmanbacteria bacterium]|nr:protein kinase [Candidatus Roizmanbacteria bacterium]